MKLWRVASTVQKHCDPWHPRLLNKTEAQLDFILEQYAKDHPKELKFERPEDQVARDMPQAARVGWTNVLLGKAKEAFVGKATAIKLPQQWHRAKPQYPIIKPRNTAPRPPVKK